MTRKIETLWVFTTETEEHGEGICAMVQRDKYLPLICTEECNLKDMINAASEMSHELGLTVTLNKFYNKEVLQVIKPIEH